MGTKMAQSYAYTFIRKLEKQLLNSSLHHPLSWVRFSDNIDMKWIESEENLKQFLDHANSIHPSFIDNKLLLFKKIHSKYTNKHKRTLFIYTYIHSFFYHIALFK